MALKQQIRTGQTLVLVTHKARLLDLVDRLVVLTPQGIALDGPKDQVLDALRQRAAAAQQQQGGGDLNGASSSLERAQRIAPREPQVLYRLAEVRLAQGDAAQAEQLARRGLTYASGRPSLQTGLWGLIAQARERQGDPAGAAEARQQAQGGR